MPVRRRSIARVHHVLTPDMKTELTSGCGGRGSSFVSDRERKLAWQLHRDEFLADRLRLPGTRPWAWWRYEANVEARPYELEPVILFEMGELVGPELDAVRTNWSRIGARRNPDRFPTFEAALNAYRGESA